MARQIPWGYKKDPRKANLGRPFEEFIEYANKRYRVDNMAVIHKIPTSFTPIRNGFGDICNVRPNEKPPMDFMGRFHGYPIAFEAKHTKEHRISMAEVDDNQSEWLDDWDRDPKAITFVIVSFNMDRIFTVPWEFWKACRDINRELTKEGSKKKYECFDTGWGLYNRPFYASFSPEELDPEWEVKIGGFNGLDYLKTIEKIFKIGEEDNG